MHGNGLRGAYFFADSAAVTIVAYFVPFVKNFHGYRKHCKHKSGQRAESDDAVFAFFNDGAGGFSGRFFLRREPFCDGFGGPNMAM